MPRKQRFKPSRKPKPMIEVAQAPIDQASPAKNAADLEPGPREIERDEVYPDDVDRKELDR